MGNVSVPPSGGGGGSVILTASASAPGRSSVNTVSSSTNCNLLKMKTIVLQRLRFEGNSPSATYRTSAMSAAANVPPTPLTIDARNLTSLVISVSASNPQGTSGQGPYTVSVRAQIS